MRFPHHLLLKPGIILLLHSIEWTQPKYNFVDQTSLNCKANCQLTQEMDTRDKCQSMLQNGNIQSFIDFFYVTHSASSSSTSKKEKFRTNMIQKDDVTFVQNKFIDIDNVRTMQQNAKITTTSTEKQRRSKQNQYQQHQQTIRTNYNDLAAYFFDTMKNKDYVKKSTYFYHQSLKISSSITAKHKHDNNISNITTMSYDYHMLINDQMVDYRNLGKCYQDMDKTNANRNFSYTGTTTKDKSTTTFALTSAIKYFEQWMKYARKISNNDEKETAATFLLQVYIKYAEYTYNHHNDNSNNNKKNGTEVALEYYVKSLECSRTLKNREKECLLCHRIGNLYLKLGQINKGNKYIKEHTHMSKALSTKSK